MKQIKFIITMLLLAALTLSFNACSSDDDDNKEENLIVGKWRDLDARFYNNYYLFTSDNKFEYYHSQEDYSEYGKYKIESGNLYFLFSDEEKWIGFRIHELTSKSLIIEEFGENGLYGDKESYERIK